MPGQYSSLTIVGPRAAQDMALPAAVPIAELLPPLLDRGTLALSDEDLMASWELATVDGRRLHPSTTLSDAGIGDGDVLHLHDVTDEVIPDPVEDVRDSVEDHVDDTGHRWKAQEGRTYAILVAAVGITVAAFLPGSNLAVLLTGVLICLMSIVVTWWAAPVNTLLAHLGVAGGALWAWRSVHLATADLVAFEDGPGQVIRHSYGAWAATLLVLVILVGTPLALPYLTGLGLTAILATPISLAFLLGVDPLSVTAATAMVMVFAIGVVPRSAMSICGLLGIDQRVQSGTEAEHRELEILIGRVDAMLVGFIVALSALGAVCSLILTYVGGTVWTAMLGGGIGFALLTRSRVFDQARHVAPFRIGGTICLAATGIAWLGVYEKLWIWLPAFLVLAALLYVAGAAMPRSTVVNAGIARVLRIAEILLVAGMLALTAQVLGLYDNVGW